jgi:hypothetical protein
MDIISDSTFGGGGIRIHDIEIERMMPREEYSERNC